MCIETFIAVKFIAAKVAAAHAAHTAAAKAAAKAAYTAHHPLSVALQETAHHGVNSIMKNPAIHPTVKAALLHVLQHGSTGTTGAAAGPTDTTSVLHNAARLAEMMALPVGTLARDTETYQKLKGLLSDRRDK